MIKPPIVIKPPACLEPRKHNPARPQEHFFESPGPGRIAAEINWRVPLPEGGFIQRRTAQEFVQVWAWVCLRGPRRRVGLEPCAGVAWGV